LDEHGYPQVERNEIYIEIFEQAENFKKNILANYWKYNEKWISMLEENVTETNSKLNVIINCTKIDKGGQW